MENLLGRTFTAEEFFTGLMILTVLWLAVWLWQKARNPNT